MKEQNIQKARGTNDILPQDYQYIKYVKDQFALVMEQAGFKYIEPPIIEYKELFTRSVGADSDIASKELFATGRIDDTPAKSLKYALRPEFTAGIVRSFIENGMSSQTMPLLFYYFGAAFRYDRPQAGRFRQLMQAGFEIFGDDSAESDALSILLVYELLERLELGEKIIFEVNTIGDSTDRPKITKALSAYFEQQQQKLCPDCQKRLKTNVLRILDCKEADCQKITENAPQILDLLSENSHNRFKATLEALDELNIAYSINPQLVRGLDYYTHIVFEVRDLDDKARQTVLGGGGRYNNLIKQLGGQAIPAIGFSFGVERLIQKIKQCKVEIPKSKEPSVYVIQIGEKAKRRCLNVIYKLHQLAIAAAPVLAGRDSLKAQLKYVDKMKAPIAVIIGQKEAIDGTAIIRNMKDGVQETVNFDELVIKLQDTLDIQFTPKK